MEENGGQSQWLQHGRRKWSGSNPIDGHRSHHRPNWIRSSTRTAVVDCDRCDRISSAVVSDRTENDRMSSRLTRTRWSVMGLPSFFFFKRSFLSWFNWFYWDTSVHLVPCSVFFSFDLTGWNAFSWVLLGFIGFFWVSLSVSGFHWVFTWFHWVLLHFTECVWVSAVFSWVFIGFLLDLTGFYLILLSFKAFLWV